MSVKTVLVTGGAGYIGSHACKALFKAGYKPVVYDNLSRGHAEAVKWGPLEVGDILDAVRLKEVLQKYHPVAVMHFAAYAYVGESVTEPMLYYRNNVLGTYNLLNQMLEKDITNFIFSSTCAIYGTPDHIPIAEDQRKVPVNPYGNTKAAVEMLLADLSALGKLRYVSLRYFNAAGADPEGEIGERHEPETHLVPLVLQALSGQRSHVEIYGTDYETRDGTCIRDYLHVSDLVNAHLLALDYLLDGGKSDCFNLGTEHGYSVREIIDHAIALTGRPITVKQAARRPGDPAALVADSGKIRRMLGWQLEHSDLETILGTAWRWNSREN